LDKLRSEQVAVELRWLSREAPCEGKQGRYLRADPGGNLAVELGEPILRDAGKPIGGTRQHAGDRPGGICVAPWFTVLIRQSLKEPVAK
jgi:hypothetical protein